MKQPFVRGRGVLLRRLIFTIVTGWVGHTNAADFQLFWQDNSNNETGFKIERKTGTSGTFAQRATVGANVTTYVDSGLPASTTFCYRVRAYNSAGNSAFTPEACKTTPSSSSTPTPTPPPSGSNHITVEAENGALTSPMVVASDSQASGGKYAYVPDGKGHSYNKQTNGGPGEVRFSINLTSSATRALWARTIAPNGTSDSFYVTRNGSLLKEWFVPISTTWKWNKIADISLPAGTVTIAFRQREDGTKLDQIILTTDRSFVPGQSTASMLAFAAAESIPSTQSTLSVSVVKTLTSNGAGDGTVISSPAGINCGTECQNAYPSGAVVQLRAIPAEGATFAGWRGHADCSDGLVTVNDEISCIATFDAQTRGLHVTKSGEGKGDVQSSPPGISCGDDCSELFASGTLVTLTASAAKGSIFKGWSGGGCGANANCTLTVSGSTSVQALFETNMADHGIAKVGIYRPATGEVFLDRNGNGDWDGCAVDLCAKWLAQAEGMPVAGDWDGSGTSRIGTFDSAAGQWYLDNNGNARWDGCGPDICLKSLGDKGDLPLVSADSAQRAVLGFYRPSDGIWRLDTNANHEFDDCAVDACYSGYSRAGALGLTGDWDGDGRGEIGTFDPDSGDWRLDYNGNGARNSCRVDRCYSGLGQAGDTPVAGDWDGSGKTKIGVFRPATGEWFLDKNGNGKLDPCSVDVCIRSFGRAGDRPLVGKW